MADFPSQVYSYKTLNTINQTESFEGETVQDQADSVRDILTRFAKDGLSPVSPSRNFEYQDTFTDKEPLYGEKIDTLLGTPDLSHFDEMQMVDYIRENSTFDSSLKEDVKDSDKKGESKEKEPPVVSSDTKEEKGAE